MEESRNVLEVIAAFQSDREKLVAFFHDKYGPALYGIVCKMISSDEGRNKVYGDVLYFLVMNVNTFDPSFCSIFTWMGNITRRQCLDYKAMGFDQEHGLPSLAIGKAGLTKLLQSLPSPYGDILQLGYFQGKNEGQIAKIFGVDKSKIRALMVTATKILRQALKDSGDDLLKLK